MKKYPIIVKETPKISISPGGGFANLNSTYHYDTFS